MSNSCDEVDDEVGGWVILLSNSCDEVDDEV